MKKITLLVALFVSAIGFAQISANSTGVEGVTTNLERSGSEILLTHSNDPATIDDGIFCGPNFPVGYAIFRSFVLADFGITEDFQVNRIQYGFFGLDGIPGSGLDVDVEVWTTDAPFPTGNLTLIATASANVTGADVLAVLETDIDATVPAGSELVIVLRTPNDGQTTVSLGANGAGQTAPSWIQSEDCIGDDTIYDLLADFALPQSWILNAVGVEVASCDSYNYVSTDTPFDIDGGGDSTADCANNPNLVNVDVAEVGVLGVDANIENVEINIQHTFDGDLDIWLVSPAGTEWILSDSNGGSGDDFIDTVFEDGGGSLGASSPPYTGVFEPDAGPFAVGFDGESVTGTWSLKVCDNFGGDTGVINNFELNLCLPLQPPPNDMIANSIDMDEIGFPYTDPQVALTAATTEDGNPVDCNIDGVNGVWYNFTADVSGPATAEVVDPDGTTVVIWFKADDENATEGDLTRVEQADNQCLPSTSSEIIVNPGQTYYLFVANTDGISDIVVDTDTVLGVEEETGIGQFSFYPNPARDAINLSAADNIEQATIYNLLGQVVINETIDATRGQINVSNLAIGTYLMKVTVNGQVGTYKIIKQ